MNAKLLIIGGTTLPYLQMLSEQDRMLTSFLGPFNTEFEPPATVRDNPDFWFALEEPYYPFKVIPGFQHRASQDTVEGLAELVLAAEAAQIGITSKIVSLNRILDIHGRLKDPAVFDGYDLIAISATYLPTDHLIRVLDRLQLPPRAKIFLGGPGAFKLDDADLQGLRFDYLLRSEAEGRFARLLQHALGHQVDLADIPNLVWRAGTELTTTDTTRSHLTLDSLPLPDFRQMASAWQGRVVYESTRGCPYRCEFCDYPFLMGNKQFRYKSAERIHQDWEMMADTMGVRDILCLDSLFTVPPKRLRRLCELMIDSGLSKRLRWGCYARSNDLANIEIAETMRAAGCQYVYIGFESGSDAVLEFMNKRATVEHSRAAIRNCDKVGMLSIGLFIAGFPGETPEMFEETRRLLREAPPFLLSLVPWAPDTSANTQVPIMQPDRIAQFAIEIETPSERPITMWQGCTFRQPHTTTWGTYWSHRGMDLQGALDCIARVQQDIYEHEIRTLSEALFLPRLLDDPLELYQRLGPRRATDFYLGLTRMILDDDQSRLPDFCRAVGLNRRLRLSPSVTAPSLAQLSRK